jgi:hypothetical protein
MQTPIANALAADSYGTGGQHELAFLPTEAEVVIQLFDDLAGKPKQRYKLDEIVFFGRCRAPRGSATRQSRWNDRESIDTLGGRLDLLAGIRTVCRRGSDADRACAPLLAVVATEAL